MNLLHTDDGIGWSARQARLLLGVQALHRQGHGVAIVCGARAELRIRALAAGLQVFDLDFRAQGWLEAARRLRTLERRANIDLIHAHGLRDARACLLLHLTGTPVVRSCDDASWFPRTLTGRCGYRRLIASDAQVTAALIDRGIDAGRVDTLAEGSEQQRAAALLAAYAQASG